MRIYSVVISDIEEREDDLKFFEFIRTSNFEYWRHTPFHWFVVTPDSTKSNDILDQAISAYKLGVFVFEVNILDFGGFNARKISEENPLAFFKKIKSEDFIPKWELAT